MHGVRRSNGHGPVCCCLLTYRYYIENVAYVTYRSLTLGCRCLVVRVVDVLGLTQLLTLSAFQIHPYCIGSSGAVCSVAERRMSQATQRSAIRSWCAMSASPIVAYQQQQQQRRRDDIDRSLTLLRAHYRLSVRSQTSARGSG